MSFILDALKKSERARQRQAGPSLFEVKIAPPKRTLPVWVVALAALLAVNAAVIGWMLLGRPAPRTAVPASAGAVSRAGINQTRSPASLSVSSRGPGSSSALPSTPISQSPNAGSGESRPGGATTAPNAAASAAEPNSPAATRTHDTAGAPTPSRASSAAAANASAGDYAPATEPSSSDSAGTDLPLYRDLESAPGNALPSLHLDLHVYDSDPSRRFVLINMHKLKQGDALADGVKVIAIRPDGVVLSYDGRRFLLAR